jgi:excisionase family DNA binding protein
LPRLLTQKEAAELLRMSVRQLQRLREAGKISFLPGRPVKLTEPALREYVEAAARPASKANPAQPAAGPSLGAARGHQMLLIRRMRGAGPKL